MSFRAAVKRNLATMARPATPVGAQEPIGSLPRSAVPVLRVPDVARAAEWYVSRLGFAVESYPAQAPHEFAILKRDGVELMVRRTEGPSTVRAPAGWDFYIRVADGELRTLYDQLRGCEVMPRDLEETPYGDLEFEVRDADGYTLCLGERVR